VSTPYNILLNFIRSIHQLLLKEPYEVDALTPAGEPTKKQVMYLDGKKLASRTANDVYQLNVNTWGSALNKNKGLRNDGYIGFPVVFRSNKGKELYEDSKQCLDAIYTRMRKILGLENYLPDPN